MLNKLQDLWCYVQAPLHLLVYCDIQDELTCPEGYMVIAFSAKIETDSVMALHC